MFSVAMRRSLWVVLATAVPAWAWFGPVNVTGDFAPAGGNFFPDMASDSQGNLHVVWCDDTWRIRHRIKFPNGVWTSVTEVSSDMAHTYWVRCTMDTSDNLHVAWHNGDSQGAMEVYYRTRAADATWSPVVNVSNTGTASIYPDIAVDGLGRVFIAWHEAIPDGGDNWEVAMAMYDGVAWQPYQVVGTSPQIDAYPVLAVDGSNTLHLAYTWDYKEIYYRSRSSSGTWTGPVNVSNNAGSSRDPHIAVSADGAPHIVWHDSTPGNWEYFYATKSGGTWQTPLNLSNSPDTIDCYGAVAVSGDGSVHAVWQDYQRGYSTRHAGPGFGPPTPRGHTGPRGGSRRTSPRSATPASRRRASAFP